LAPISKAKLGSPNNLLAELKSSGYKTYCASSNPFISPGLGFLFDEFHEFRETGDVTIDRHLLMNSSGLKSGLILLKNRRLRHLGGRLYSRLFSGILGRFGVQQMEKGSKFITRYFERTHLEEPFFAFVNLMEAHDPYIWGERVVNIRPSILGKPVNLPWWRGSYPLHAKLAVSKALRIVSLLLEHDPLIIVVSDHGQLLGEGGRYGHGFFLDDELVRVPIYVRFPGGENRLEFGGQFVSLTEVPGIVEGAIHGKRYLLGSDYAISQSFGSQVDLKNPSPDILRRVFARRTRVLSRDGSITYNQDTGAVEDATRGLTPERIEALKQLVPVQKGDNHFESDEKESAADMNDVRDRLRRLGYE
jgi:hypothetical protein